VPRKLPRRSLSVGSWGGVLAADHPVVAFEVLVASLEDPARSLVVRLPDPSAHGDEPAVTTERATPEHPVGLDVDV
jgi:hypothetical protein